MRNAGLCHKLEYARVVLRFPREKDCKMGQQELLLIGAVLIVVPTGEEMVSRNVSIRAKLCGGSATDVSEAPKSFEKQSTVDGSIM